MARLRKLLSLMFFFVLMIAVFGGQDALARDTDVRGPRIAPLPVNRVFSPPKPVIKKKNKPEPKKEGKKPENPPSPPPSPREQAESEE